MKQKSVLFLQRSVPPDSSASGRVLLEMASALVRHGWKVDILASRIPSQSLPFEKINGVGIHRVRTFPFTRKNLILRAASLASVYPAFLFKAFFLPCPDVLVSLTDPPLINAVAELLRRYWKIPHVHWAQDVYPETAIELGVLGRNAIHTRALRRIAHTVLRNAQAVIPIGGCMEAYFKTLGVSHLKKITNWSDPDFIRPDEQAGNAFRMQHGLGKNFLIFYIGNLGMAHNLEWFTDISELLRNRVPNARLVFAGNGPRKKWLIKTVRERHLDNILILDALLKSDFSAAYSAADIHVTSLNYRLAGLVVPSKIYASLASQRPCVFIGPLQSEAAKIIVETNSGAAFDPSEKEKFIEFILSCKERPDLQKQYGDHARQAACLHTLEPSAIRFEEMLSELISPGQTPRPESFSEQSPNPKAGSNA